MARSRSPSTPSTRRRGPGRPAGGHSGEARDAILAAARELLAERGLPRVTLRAVGERAGVQPALVNYYFGSKRALFRDVVRGVAAEVRERIAAEALQPGAPAERIRHVLRAIAAAFAEHPYAPRLLFEHVLFADDATLDEFAEAYARPNVEVMRSLFEEGRRQGVLRDVDVAFLGPQVIGMMFFFFVGSPLIARVFDLDCSDPRAARRFADSVADLVLHGISSAGAATPQGAR